MTPSLLHEISRFTAQAFVAGLWQGIVLISAVAIGLRLLPRLSASIRFAIWSLTFALAATLPLLHLQIPADKRTAIARHADPSKRHLGNRHSRNLGHRHGRPHRATPHSGNPPPPHLETSNPSSRRRNNPRSAQRQAPHPTLHLHPTSTSPA